MEGGDGPGLRLDAQLVGGDFAELGELAAEAERAGFDRVWAPELHRSSTVPLAAAATATSSLELGTGIALAFTRSPFVMALEMLDLDELSGGRAVLGLGAGVRRLNERWHAAAYDPPVARMRELIAAVRELIAALSARRDARAEGEIYDIHVVGFRRPHHAPRGEIPLWLAAVLPGMTALAGEVADGFLDHPVTTLEWLEGRLRPALAGGAARADREPPEVAGALICAVDDDDPDRAREAAAATVGFYATVKTYKGLFAEHGHDGRLPAIQRAFISGVPGALADAVGPEMTDTFAAAGTGEEVRARVAAYEARVDRLWVTPPHHDQDAAAIGGWQRAIIRALAR